MISSVALRHGSLPKLIALLFQIPGYTLLCENRTFSTGGGVALYVRSGCSFSIRNDLKIDSIENLWIETDNMIVGVIYKPPNISNLEFLDKFERTLHNVFLSKKKCVFMGDININILTKTSVSKEYINLIQSEGFSQLIFEATRITENSQSCIDHIFTNISTPCSSGSLAVEIADHLPVFSILYDPKFNPFPDYLEFRDFRGFESENFKLDLGRESWDSIYKCNEVNECYTRFLHIFNRVSNIHAPLKKAKIKHKAYKPWITSGLKKSMKIRDKLYKKWLVTRNLVFLTKYKLYRNKITIINKIYRDNFYNDILTKSDSTKKMWDNINLLINKKRPSSHIEKLQVDNKQYEQPLTISNCLNKFFCDVPSRLAAQLPKSVKSATSYLSQEQKQFRFVQVSEIEVFLLLESLDTSKSFGIDKIHPLLLKTAALQIYRP